MNTAGAPGSIQVLGDDFSVGGGGLPGGQDTDYTHLALASGSFSFSWLYTTNDTGTWDSAFFLINGVATFLSNNTTPGASGGVSVPVVIGDVIGFRVRSADGDIGRQR